MDLRQAMALSITVYDGLKDRCGLPYWTHPFRVMLRLGAGASHDERVAAIFHDAIEDTPYGESWLASQGVSPGALHIIKGCTHPKYLGRETVTYGAWIQEIADHPMGDVNRPSSARVKIADILDNTDPLRRAIAEKLGWSPPVKRYIASLSTLRQAVGADVYRSISDDLATDPSFVTAAERLGLSDYVQKHRAESREALQAHLPGIDLQREERAARPRAKQPRTQDPRH